jgi:hypothetical protein
MANVTIDTQAAGYQTRLTQYNEIMQFWKPNLIEFFKMDPEQRQAWRAADPFLDRILKVTQAITELRDDDI